jgi:hypothetical protein
VELTVKGVSSLSKLACQDGLTHHGNALDDCQQPSS